MPADQSMAASISESLPPHLPSARTGRIQLLHVRPPTPVALLVMAPRMPTTRVPCQELFSTVQPVNSAVFVSAVLTQSPGSEASGLRPAPLLPTSGSDTKSYPSKSR